MNNLTNSQHSQLDAPELDGAQLFQRLDAVSVNSDLFEFLELVRDLATAGELARLDVAAHCARELDALDASIIASGDGVE